MCCIGIAPNKVIGLYFSAHWCPPCRQFTPYLKQLYNEWKKQNNKIEIIFISGDRDYNQFKSYFEKDHGSWLALPFGCQEIQKVNQKFQVRGIPTLIFLDSSGNVIEMNGRNLVQKQGVNAFNTLSKNIPEPKKESFHGKAHSLIDENVIKNGITMYDYIQEKELKINDDEDDEQTIIQIQLINGTKKTLKINMNKQTVGDLFGHVKWLHNPGPFKLLAGFPPKELKDEAMTVSEAELKGVRVIQKKL